MSSEICRGTLRTSVPSPSTTRISSLAKTFAITERVKAEFRGEFFNAFNRHVFNKPDSGVQDTNFGQVGSTLLGPRNGQFVLRINF